MNKKTKFLLGTTLLCMSQMAFADCEAPDAPEDCWVVYGDDNDSVDHSSGGGSGGSVSTDGGSQQSDSANNGGGNGGGSSGSNEPMTKEQCLARVNTIHSQCNYKANAAHTSYLKDECDNLGTVSGDANNPVVHFGVMSDEYKKCENLANSTLRTDLSQCTYQKNRYTEYCLAP